MRCSKPRCPTGKPRRPLGFRPQVEALNLRLLLGVAVLGGLIGLSLSGSAPSLQASGLSVTKNAGPVGTALGKARSRNPFLGGTMMGLAGSPGATSTLSGPAPQHGSFSHLPLRISPTIGSAKRSHRLLSQ
jgi:hypothetical protein